MESLIISNNDETPYFPQVNFNAETGILDISGESYMEDTYKFYIPIIDWLKAYLETEKKDIAFNIRLLYFNTSTSRCILEMFDILRNKLSDGRNVVVNWHYDKEDPDMISDIEDIQLESGLPINIIGSDMNS